MGIIDDFKKLIFGAKSVSKSAAGKAMDKGRETGEKIVEESGELWDKAKEKAAVVGEDIIETSDQVWEKAMDSTEDIRKKVQEKTNESMDVAEDVGKLILEKGGQFANKAKDLAEDIGEKILDKSGVLKDRSGETADDLKKDFRDIRDEEDDDEDVYAETIDDLFEDDKKSDQSIVENTQIIIDDNDEPSNESEESGDSIADVGSKVPETGGSDMVDKAKAIADKMSDVLDDTIEKARQMADEEMKPRKAEGTPGENLKKALLDNDDFFRKANAFAEGRYDEVHDQEPEGETKITRDPDYKKEVKKNDAMLPGFEDLDGDGNELIDDALLLTDEEE